MVVGFIAEWRSQISSRLQDISGRFVNKVNFVPKGVKSQSRVLGVSHYEISPSDDATKFTKSAELSYPYHPISMAHSAVPPMRAIKCKGVQPS